MRLLAIIGRINPPKVQPQADSKPTRNLGQLLQPKRFNLKSTFATMFVAHGHDVPSSLASPYIFNSFYVCPDQPDQVP